VSAAVARGRNAMGELLCTIRARHGGSHGGGKMLVLSVTTVRTSLVWHTHGGACSPRAAVKGFTVVLYALGSWWNACQ